MQMPGRPACTPRFLACDTKSEDDPFDFDLTHSTPGAVEAKTGNMNVQILVHLSRPMRPKAWAARTAKDLSPSAAGAEPAASIFFTLIFLFASSSNRSHRKSGKLAKNRINSGGRVRSSFRKLRP
jgi:hypothetical protein